MQLNNRAERRAAAQAVEIIANLPPIEVYFESAAPLPAINGRMAQHLEVARVEQRIAALENQLRKEREYLADLKSGAVSFV